MIFTNPQERTRFLRFAVVGIIGAVVDFGTMNVSTIIFHIPFIPATVISFCAAVISNFLWNRFWTYPDSRSKSIHRQVTQFFIINTIGLLVIRWPLLTWLEPNLISKFTQMLPANFFFSARFMGHNVSLAIAVLIVMMWNFFANRYWTYNDVS